MSIIFATREGVRASSGVFFDPGRQGVARDPKDAVDTAHTGPFLRGA